MILAEVGEKVGETSDNWKVYLLFIASGFLLGGTWAAWQARSKFLTVVTAVLALMAGGVALYWLIGEMT